MSPSLSSITVGVAVAFRQQQLSSENARLTLQNNSLLQENSQLQSEDDDLRLQQQRLNASNRQLNQQVDTLQRELTAQHGLSKGTGGTQHRSALDVYA